VSRTSFPPALVDALRAARPVAVLTGAGISAESGVPTFRDAQSGLWSRFRPEELATAEAYRRNPRLVWDWYAWRRGLVRDARPNAAHLALVSMEARIPDFTLITQNVDGLHALAGSRRLLELHGNIHRNRCFQTDDAAFAAPCVAAGAASSSPEASRCRPGADAPRCEHCGGWVRPDVVWFGEGLPEQALMQAQAAAVASRVFLSIGTSALVHPAAGLPLLAQRAGALLVEINREATPLSGQAQFSLRGLAGELLPALVGAAWP
jgi:NAD-dependent deacetylase